MKKSTASRKVEWLQTPGSQSEETLPRLPLQRIGSTELEESDPFAAVEEDEDELEENKLVLEDC